MSRRLFLGVSATPQIEAQLVAAQHQLTLLLPETAKPVARDNLHLTLAFLGDVELADELRLWQAVTQQQWPTITLSCGQWQCWPRAQVLCLQGQQTAAWCALTEQLNRVVKAVGLSVSHEQPVPHWTLFRKCKALPSELVSEDAQWLAPEVELRIDQIKLFWSKSSEHGVQYQVLSQCPCGG